MKRCVKGLLLAVGVLVGSSSWAQVYCPDGGIPNPTGQFAGLCSDGSVPQAGGGGGGGGGYDGGGYTPPTVVYLPTNYGAVAYGPGNASGSSWNYTNQFDAERAATQACGHKDCWAYSFQGGYGAMAKQVNGQELFAEWSGQSEQQAKAVALRSCEKVTGKGKCQIVVSSAAQK
jgi:hypothetical protein